ncbi:MAG: response regulator transcription factor [Calothrix sp. SM1_5_4]|nr:response regulator transcription factor [Calothrix sp. SM1_5_4]
MHLLLVEDDPRLSQYMREALGREGYTLEVCSSIDEVNTYMVMERESPRVVILDRMLGRADGAALIPKLKTRYPEAGILVLSSLDMPSEKARIIDAGADEYVSKPFSLDELTARLRLVVRRSARAEEGDPALRMLGNLVLDLKTQNATAAGHKLDLTRKEFQLLSLLMDSPGRVYNRFQILDRVWEIERMTESNVVETTIKNLRRKLEEAGASVRIESRRNMGYWIET